MTETPNVTADYPGVQRCILQMKDLDLWQKCDGHTHLISFVKQLNHFATGKEHGSSDYAQVSDKLLCRLVQALEDLSTLVDKVPPIMHDRNQRFGNQAYRTWFDRMKEYADSYLTAPHIENVEHQLELRAYLCDSFGNRQRIDYGTGHELNFIVFLMGLYKIYMTQDAPKEEYLRSISEQVLRIFSLHYLPLCRKLQLTYRLEPAGSHGVYSMDDFQYLPFLFGSAELVGHTRIEPRGFPEQEIAETLAKEFTFHAAISFIFKVKTGPFYEHSNQLWNISGVDDWGKINRGLYKKYLDEVLHKFPIVQHLVFGKHILCWSFNV